VLRERRTGSVRPGRRAVSRNRSHEPQKPGRESLECADHATGPGAGRSRGMFSREGARRVRATGAPFPERATLDKGTRRDSDRKLGRGDIAPSSQPCCGVQRHLLDEPQSYPSSVSRRAAATPRVVDAPQSATALTVLVRSWRPGRPGGQRSRSSVRPSLRASLRNTLAQRVQRTCIRVEAGLCVCWRRGPRWRARSVGVSDDIAAAASGGCLAMIDSSRAEAAALAGNRTREPRLVRDHDEPGRALRRQELRRGRSPVQTSRRHAMAQSDCSGRSRRSPADPVCDTRLRK